MKTEICTSIEQSKKLLKLGLDADTADMGYNGVENRDTGRIWYDKYPTTMPNVDSIPAWSLSALLELMPPIAHNYPVVQRCSSTTYHYGEQNHKWFMSYVDLNEYGEISPHRTSFLDSPIDAAFELICFLIERGYIKTEKKCID